MFRSVARESGRDNYDCVQRPAGPGTSVRAHLLDCAVKSLAFMVGIRVNLKPISLLHLVFPTLYMSMYMCSFFPVLVLVIFADPLRQRCASLDLGLHVLRQ